MTILRNYYYYRVKLVATYIQDIYVYVKLTSHIYFSNKRKKYFMILSS